MRKLILIAVLVLAALAGGIAYVLASGDGEARRAGALVGSYSTGRLALQLDGATVAFPKSVSCGAVDAEVQRTELAETAKGNTDPKQIGSARYQPCELEIPLGGINPTVAGWVSQALSGQAAPKTLNIQYLDFDYKEKRRLELVNASLVEVKMPKAQASANKDPAQITFTVAPEIVRAYAGSGATVSTSGTPKSQLASNFKFTWSGSLLASVAEVGAWSVTIDPATRRPQFSDLEIVVSENEPKLATLESSFKKFLVDGQNADVNETTATLEFLDATLTVPTFKYSFAGVGWAGGDLVGQTSAETAIGKRRYTLYFERASFAVL